jgi:hypothetical protein
VWARVPDCAEKRSLEYRREIVVKLTKMVRTPTIKLQTSGVDLPQAGEHRQAAIIRQKRARAAC